MAPYYMGHSFGQPEPAVLSVSPPSFWCTPSLPASKAAQEAEESSAPCKHCSASTKNIGMLAVLFSSKIQNRTLCEPPQRKLTLSQPKPWQNVSLKLPVVHFHLITSFYFFLIMLKFLPLIVYSSREVLCYLHKCTNS